MPICAFMVCFTAIQGRFNPMLQIMRIHFEMIMILWSDIGSKLCWHFESVATSASTWCGMRDAPRTGYALRIAPIYISVTRTSNNRAISAAHSEYMNRISNSGVNKPKHWVSSLVYKLWGFQNLERNGKHTGRFSVYATQKHPASFSVV